MYFKSDLIEIRPQGFRKQEAGINGGYGGVLKKQHLHTNRYTGWMLYHGISSNLRATVHRAFYMLIGETRLEPKRLTLRPLDVYGTSPIQHKAKHFVSSYQNQYLLHPWSPFTNML